MLFQSCPSPPPYYLSSLQKLAKWKNLSSCTVRFCPSNYKQKKTRTQKSLKQHLWNGFVWDISLQFVAYFYWLPLWRATFCIVDKSFICHVDGRVLDEHYHVNLCGKQSMFKRQLDMTRQQQVQVLKEMRWSWKFKWQDETATVTSKVVTSDQWQGQFLRI